MQNIKRSLVMDGLPPSDSRGKHRNRPHRLQTETVEATNTLLRLKVKAVVTNDTLQVIFEESVQFDNELPQYRTHGGVNKSENGLTVTAPTVMWIKALDMLMDKLRICGLDFNTIVSLSGTGQQHGSVYWKKGARSVLNSLSAHQFLHEQLQNCFAIPDSPVWMDTSTTVQCRQLENKVGGPQELANITGSRAHERLTGNQIAKVYQTRPNDYHNTERISLVSSFGCSLFLGDFAPIDYSDGSGMNLLDIRSKKWFDVCMESCAPDLHAKLGEPVPSFKDVGPISSFFVERFGFSTECRVIAFTGDNPASVAGLRLQKGDIALSLGTSDTVFMWLSEPNPSLDGNIFCNPIEENEYMALLCFKNGSLTRERIRNKIAEDSWNLFNELLDSTPRGNFGNLGMYYDVQEITPFITGDHRFNKANTPVTRFPSKEVEVRALIEGQCLAKRIHAENLGCEIGGPNVRVLATGGASLNRSILQVLSDVFNAPVYTETIANSACLGCAYRAKHGLLGGSVTFGKVVSCLKESDLTCTPNKDAAQIYNPLAQRYRKLEESIVQAGK